MNGIQCKKMVGIMDVEVRATQVMSVWIHLLALFCPNKSISIMGFQPLTGGPSIILSPGLPVEVEPKCFVVCMRPALIWAPQQRGVCVCLCTLLTGTGVSGLSCFDTVSWVI